MEVTRKKSFPQWKLELIEELHNKGKTLNEIANMTRIRHSSLRKKMDEMGLEPNGNMREVTRPYRRKAMNKSTGDAADTASPPEVNYAAIAEKELEKRLTYKRGMRLLDGNPCSLDEMMRAANMQRRAGLGKYVPLGKKQEWI